MAGEGRVRIRKLFLAGIVMALLLPARSRAAGEQAASIELPVNQSKIVTLERRAKRVSVTLPKIAEVIVVSPKEILIHGKTVGSTSLVVWDEKQVVTHFNLLVTPDVIGLSRQLAEIFPNEDIQVSSSGAAIVLEGEVSNELVYDKVLSVADSFVPPEQAEQVAPGAQQNVTVAAPRLRLPQTGTAFAGGGSLAFEEENRPTDSQRWGTKRGQQGIIDLLKIKEFRQIQLNVTVAEVALSKLRELGVDFSLFFEKSVAEFLSGSQGGLEGGALRGGSIEASPQGITVPFSQAGTSAAFAYVSGGAQAAALFRLLEDKDAAEILAEPRLVIKNGRSGSFLSGGEFPFPAPQSGSAGFQTFTIEFRPFGVRLEFVPTITWSGTIDLRVFPEVSEIDEGASITIGGISVPGLRVRRSVSRVEMEEGETLVIGGLLDKRRERTMTKFPVLGDIPIIGAMFRATSFQDEETELIFIITPRIVTATREQPKVPNLEEKMDPDIRQFPVPRMRPGERWEPDEEDPEGMSSEGTSLMEEDVPSAEDEPEGQGEAGLEESDLEEESGEESRQEEPSAPDVTRKEPDRLPVPPGEALVSLAPDVVASESGSDAAAGPSRDTLVAREGIPESANGQEPNMENSDRGWLGTIGDFLVPDMLAGTEGEEVEAVEHTTASMNAQHAEHAEEEPADSPAEPRALEASAPVAPEGRDDFIGAPIGRAPRPEEQDRSPGYGNEDGFMTISGPRTPDRVGRPVTDVLGP